VVLEKAGALADRGQNLEEVLEQVLRRREQRDDQAGGNGGAEHRPAPCPQEEKSHRRLDQLQSHRQSERRAAPPAIGDPAEKPDSRQGEQDQVDLTLDDVAVHRFERDRHEHHERAYLPVDHAQRTQHAQEKDHKRCVEEHHSACGDQVAVDAYQRLEEPGHRRRRDVLLAGRLEAAERLAEVVWIAPCDELSSGAKVALFEVTEVPAERDRHDDALPDVKEKDRYACHGQEQRSKLAIFEGGAPGHAGIVLDVPSRWIVNEAAPAADTASTGCHRVTRRWFLRRFTAVAFLWRPTFAWAVGGPGRPNWLQIATA